VAVLDLRDEDTIYAVNRFMIYAHVSHHQHLHRTCCGACRKQNTVFAAGKSISEPHSRPPRSATMLLEYGGGGHDNAGTCQIANDGRPACCGN